MFCHSCGARNSDTSLFCTSCGMRLSPSSIPGGTTRVFGPAPGANSGQRAGHGPGPYPAPADGSGYPSDISSQGSRGGLPYPAGNHWPDSTVRAMTPYAQPYTQPYADTSGRTRYPAHTLTCAECGLPRSAAMDTCPYCGRVVFNDSGQNAAVPLEVAAGWNWGAFFLPVLWSIAHENWFGLLALLPGLNIIMPFVLGARGNELAWQHRRFQSVEHFLEVQRTWRNCAIGTVAILAAIWVMLQFAGAG